jgi:hypothetical protein
MDSRQRPPVTLKVMFYALLDAAGMLVFASGLMWLVRQQDAVHPRFPDQHGQRGGHRRRRDRPDGLVSGADSARTRQTAV